MPDTLRYNCRILTAIPLTKKEKQELYEIIMEKTGKKYRIEFSVDPSVITGLHLQIEDKLIDMTIRKKIESLKERLLA